MSKKTKFVTGIIILIALVGFAAWQFMKIEEGKPEYQIGQPQPKLNTGAGYHVE